MEAELASLFSAAPSLEDNRVRYDFFLLRPPASPASNEPSTSAQDAAEPPLAFAQEAEDRSEAERMRDDLLSLAAQQTRGFLWHRHGFHLSVRALPQALHRVRGLRGFFLTGETAVGDAIQDEWVVARLVLALSRRHASLVARLSDADGEFLLIEAADVLPDWVTPDNSTHRVLVHRGRVHILRPGVAASSSRTRSTSKTRDAVPDALVDALDAMATAVGSADDVARAFEAGVAIQRVLETKLERETVAYMRENRHLARCLLPRRAALVLRELPALVGPAVEAFYYREPTRAGLLCGRMATFGAGGADAAVETRVAFSRAMFAMLKQQPFHPPKPFLAAPRGRFHVLLSASSDPARRSAADLGVKLACGLELLYAAEDACDQFGARYRDLMDAILAREDAASVVEDGTELIDDDDAWMAVHPDALEEQLAGLERRFGRHDSEDEDGLAKDVGGAEELQQVASMFSSFLCGVSDVDGVQGAAPVQFDMASFMDILNGTSGDHDASDSDQDADSEGEEDGDEDAALAEAMDEMEAELADSTLAKSFVRPEGRRASADAASVDSNEEEEEETGDDHKPQVTPETPLDLDFNLLSNLLESFASQEGQSGPVSNILSELRLPRAAGQ